MKTDRETNGTSRESFRGIFSYNEAHFDWWQQFAAEVPARFDAAVPQSSRPLNQSETANLLENGVSPQRPTAAEAVLARFYTSAGEALQVLTPKNWHEVARFDEVVRYVAHSALSAMRATNPTIECWESFCKKIKGGADQWSAAAIEIAADRGVRRRWRVRAHGPTVDPDHHRLQVRTYEEHAFRVMTARGFEFSNSGDATDALLDEILRYSIRAENAFLTYRSPDKPLMRRLCTATAEYCSVLLMDRKTQFEAPEPLSEAKDVFAKLGEKYGETEENRLLGLMAYPLEEPKPLAGAVPVESQTAPTTESQLASQNPQRSRRGPRRKKPDLHPEVRKYLDRVSAVAGRIITFHNFAVVSGYGDTTVLSRWRRGDPQVRSGQEAKFLNTLRLKPEEFLSRLAEHAPRNKS